MGFFSILTKLIAFGVLFAVIGGIVVREHNLRGNKLWFDPIPTADLNVDLSGKLMIVTGANTGIGRETTIALLSMGADVVMACRSAKRAADALPEITQRASLLAKQHNHQVGKVDASLLLDLSSFSSIERFVDQFHEKYGDRSLDVLVNNAAVANDNLRKTEQGFSEVLGVNHFGVFKLTHLLLDDVIAAKGRIVVVASNAHLWADLDLDDMDSSKYTAAQRQTDAFTAYGNSKLANIIMANQMAERLASVGVTVNSLHPGFIKTELIRSATGWVRQIGEIATNLIAMDAWQGAQNTIHLASSPKLEKVSGAYFVHFNIEEPTLPSPQVQAAFFEKSLALTKTKDYHY
mmetsp:Transcript_6167/g.9595  ORF Transcript_6167/g.9595 Transcript_6167/m.9595 type:complete len:348 (-) Transcript_6167:51-1094(-)|eukprot:CAMPEP_0201544660 /NCGR_PEP_ID=MMETSP0173_2-20130828/1286_1 /ASSEMBLY_ACC=CAM_ASM_000268 /TAXON_ID=218659 /ORGANISM="Vexillifera sp., Strain DIVA3 564/2" /LENGTH=347 /DNA_ID=CAMNT_0047952859 /DNA_START=6 /DNA_END=1049 /DNA_ORIENTATION=+